MACPLMEMLLFVGAVCVYTSQEIFDIIGGDDYWKDF